MSTLYQYDDVGAPSQGYIDVMLSRGSFPAMTDISYNPEERWLKLWFSEELSSSQEAAVSQIVVDSQSQPPHFAVQSGYYYNEVYSDSNGWTTHQACITFQRQFVELPTVAIDPPKTSGAADIKVIDAQKTHFLVSMRVKGRRHVSVEFNWEAWG